MEHQEPTIEREIWFIGVVESALNNRGSGTVVGLIIVLHLRGWVVETGLQFLEIIAGSYMRFLPQRKRGTGWDANAGLQFQ